MDKTEGFAPQLARKGKFHTPQAAYFTLACEYFTRASAFHFGFIASDKPKIEIPFMFNFPVAYKYYP